MNVLLNSEERADSGGERIANIPRMQHEEPSHMLAPPVYAATAPNSMRNKIDAPETKGINR